MNEFGGWEMPIQYSGIIGEHKHCRMSASLFDTCHMGEFYLKGTIKTCGIENILSNLIHTIPIGRCRYSFLMNEKGGVEDDLICYRLSEEELMIVVNAGTKNNDFQLFQQALSPETI